MSECLRLLQELAGKPAAIEWFRGLFHRVHVHVVDTDERFTVVHHGDRAEVQPGFQGDTPNFVIPLESQNIRNLSGFFEDDAVDPQEEYRIVKFMLQPCLRAGLAMPILQNPTVRRVLKIDTHWQEALLDPQGREDEQLTVLHVNNQWLVLPGYHGRPQRRLVMKPEQVLDYQRRVFEANEKNSMPVWMELFRWYGRWRDEVSVPV